MTPAAYVLLLLFTAAILLMFVFTYMESDSMLQMTQYEAIASVLLSVSFPLAVFSYLTYRKGSLRGAITSLGLGRDKLTLRTIIIGAILFGLILILEMSLGAFQSITHINLPSNVSEIYTGFPIWFFILSFTIIPFNEEVLFRGFMVPRIGIIFAAIVFAVMHLEYLSISEFAAAFIYGILAGYTFKKTGSLYTTIIAHALVNAIAVMGLLLLI